LSKNIPAAITAIVESNAAEFYYAVEGLFDNGAVRLWTGYGTKDINGQEYQGAGEILQIDGLNDVSDLSSRAVTITLSGVGSAITSLALNESFQNRTVNIYLGVVGVDDPVLIYSGLADVMPIEDSGEVSTISLILENDLAILEKVEGRRYTDESQRARFPNDSFFSRVSTMEDTQTLWGRNA
jgi:hypothetical protein